MKNVDKFERFALNGGCSSSTNEDISVSVPVSIRANCNVGNVDIDRVGPATIDRCCDTCGRPNAVDKFVVTQRIRVEIPLEFGAECDVGQSFVDFHECCNGGNNSRPDNNCGRQFQRQLVDCCCDDDDYDDDCGCDRCRKCC
jgi:hypothetical protein